jgi:intracellular sulfur oxidation DsrE/DsrF family protein
MKQLNNLLSVAPTAEIEVVCHGPGLEMLVASQSKVAEKLDGFRKKGIAFVGCEFSMRERKIDKSMLLPSAGTVPAAILEIVMKQEQGWSYIKAGF